jgi:thioredoxin 1
MAIEINESNFDQEVLKSGTPVIVDFYAEWCGPCKQMSPIIDTLAKEYADQVKFVKVDIDKSRDLAIKYGVTSIPTLIFIKDGNPVSKEVGYKAKEELQALTEAFK